MMEKYHKRTKRHINEVALDSLKSKDFPLNTQVLWYQDLILNTPDKNQKELNSRFSPFPGFRTFKDKRIGACGVLRKQHCYRASEKLKLNEASLRNAFVAVPVKDKLTPVEKSQGIPIISKLGAPNPLAIDNTKKNPTVAKSDTGKKLEKIVGIPESKATNKEELNILYNALPSNVPLVSPNNPKQQSSKPKSLRPVNL